jgi:RNA polymerase sigma-70 factor (ECF subfamily)
MGVASTRPQGADHVHESERYYWGSTVPRLSSTPSIGFQVERHAVKKVDGPIGPAFVSKVRGQTKPSGGYLMNTFGPCLQRAASSPASSHQKQESLSKETEAEIVVLAQTGDAEAFEHLYRVHSRRVYALCFRMTRNPSLAEDLTQEAFLQVFRKIRSFRGKSAFSTWLYRLAFNMVLMKRRIKKFNEVSFEELCKMEGDNLPIEQIGRWDARVLGALDRITLEDALKELPRGYRKIFMLHEVLGYEHQEIAKALGCAIGTSKSQLHKARMYLRKILQNGNRTNPLSNQPIEAARSISGINGRWIRDRANRV